MTSNLVTVILFKRPPMPFTVMMARFVSPVLSAQFMTPIPTLILNLTSSWSLSLRAVGYALFYPLWVRSCHLSEVLVGAVNSSLFSTVRTFVRSPASPFASAELTLPVQCEVLVTSRTWLSTC